ncbi:NAD(P)H-binding protein [bacterium]|nr:NAD(P)H-binding protein [bacterium]
MALKDENLILVTGATGYIGGRLLTALEKRGKKVRCLARKPEHLLANVAAGTQVVKGDLFDTESLKNALEGVHTAYYFVHSLGGGSDYEQRDRQAAANFSEAARTCGVSKIIYLGGLGSGNGLSTHLASRQEVGRILRESGVGAIEFRASIILGSGSLSFELIRALVGRLPVMITPRWVRTPAQPISIKDVIEYLVQALDVDARDCPVFEIGGADIVSYLGIMRQYAARRGVTRLFIPVPVLTPWLSSLWLALVTPLYARVGRQLIEGVRNETTVHDTSARDSFTIRPMGIVEAIDRAMNKED